MNKLDRVIIGQYERLQIGRPDHETVLREIKAEVMEVVNPELVFEIIDDRQRMTPDMETSSSRAQIRAFDSNHSITSRTAHQLRNANGLARIGMLRPEQGYTGGIIRNGNDLHVFGGHMSVRKPENDPIQAEAGDTFYAGMMWVKALWAAGYEHRPESAHDLDISTYLAKLGMTLGAAVTEQGDLVGATGFMPGERLLGLTEYPEIAEHIGSEPIEAFRLSGLCDQAVVNPDILMRTGEFAREIIAAGGSLN